MYVGAFHVKVAVVSSVLLAVREVTGPAPIALVPTVAIADVYA